MQFKRRISAVLLSWLMAFSFIANAGHHADHSLRPEQLQHLHGSLQALRSALVRIGEEKQKQDYTDPIAEKSLRLEQTAKQLAEQGDSNKAQQQLALAMDIIKTAISTLRNQETLIRSLNFATAEDEYLYEKQRYESYCALADLLIKSKKDISSMQLRQQAKIIADAATQQASALKYDAALKTQEQSNQLVIQSIRRSGVYIPG
jgi:hypothetical protein